jgi:hypothetical protein
MLAKNEQAQDEAYRKRTSEPVSTGDAIFFNGFMLTMVAIGVIGLASPA